MFQFSSIEQYHAQLKKKEVSCKQVVQYYLDRIKSSSQLNAFIEVYASEALQKAEELDQKRMEGESIGLLHGVIVGLKDVIAFKGHTVTASSKILKGFTSLYSATVVEKLINEEAIIIGNCNCDEFAMGSTNENSAYGNVLNALDETRVPGGSSGGSAVAVQANLCMIALGSDTGGSVRQPADFCGIIGLKPGYGRISRHGLIAYASSFDQIGVLAHNVGDVALALKVISGPDEYDATVSHTAVDDYPSALNIGAHKKFRFAYFNESLSHAGLDPEIGHAIRDTISDLAAEGHEEENVDFGYLDYVVPAYYILTTAEASSNLSRYDGVRYGNSTKNSDADLNEFYKQSRSEGFGKEVQRRILLGTFVLSSGYFDAYFTKAQQVRQLLVQKMDEIFLTHDFVILPNAPSTAFKLGEKSEDPITMYLSDIFTVLANLVGCAAISLPLYRHSNGMPFGVQILAKKSNEVSLLRISQQLMQQVPDVIGTQ